MNAPYKKLLLLTVATIFFLFATPLRAAENFKTSLQSTYSVDDVGNTTVAHTISITNTTPTTFIKQYALKTTALDLRSVDVQYRGKPLEAHVITTDQGTSIAIDFPDEVVGEGKSRTFTISYIDGSIATIGGRVLELHIPKAGDQTAFDSQAATIITPVRFGLPVRSVPQPTTSMPKGATIATTYESVEGKPISLLFGREQYYQATLRYHLENSGAAQGLAQIALPPDTSFQKVHYESLDPLPRALKQDEDGNWIATYNVPAKSVLTVNLLTRIKITLEPNNIPIISPLPQHTQSQPFWDVSHPTITDKAAALSTPHDIYNFVTQALSYSNQPLQDAQRRLGGVGALEDPKTAVCQEFTDLFITLARNRTIPARRLTGYAYTQNEKVKPLSLEGDILHAWPEYFNKDQQVWSPVDPTWGVTTGGIDYFSQFDLNHIVFAINGISSTNPFAAGFYKTASFNSKDIDVSFADGFPEISPSVSLLFKAQTLFGVPIPGLYTAYITNQTGQAQYNTQLIVEAEESDPAHYFEVNKTIPILLPYQTIEIPLAALTQTWSLPKRVPATATILDETGTTIYVTENLSLTSTPPSFTYLNNPTIVLGMGISIAFVTLTAGSVLVFRRKK